MSPDLLVAVLATGAAAVCMARLVPLWRTARRPGIRWAAASGVATGTAIAFALRAGWSG